jgi:hypothetical protein
MQLELRQIDLRYAALRIADATREAALAASMLAEGQRHPVLVVADAESRYVLVDGYRRVRALAALGRDSCSPSPVQRARGARAPGAWALAVARRPSRRRGCCAPFSPSTASTCAPSPRAPGAPSPGSPVGWGSSRRCRPRSSRSSSAGPCARTPRRRSWCRWRAPTPRTASAGRGGVRRSDALLAADRAVVARVARRRRRRAGAPGRSPCSTCARWRRSTVASRRRRRPRGPRASSLGAVRAVLEGAHAARAAARRAPRGERARGVQAASTQTRTRVGALGEGAGGDRCWTLSSERPSCAGR